MPGESGEAIQPSSINDNNVVLVGSSDHTPSRFNLGRYVRTVGLLFLVGVGAACAPTPEKTVPMTADVATAHPEIAALVTDAIEYHTVRLEKVSTPGYDIRGMNTISPLGMGVVFNETKGPDGSVTDTMGTVDHVLFNGTLLAKLNINNAYGKWLPKFIDDSDPAGLGWSIVNIPDPDPDPTKNDGITVFSITRPDSEQSLTNGTTIEVNTTPLVPGDKIFFTRTPKAKNYNAFVTTTTIKSVVIDEYGNTVYLTEGTSEQGDSGTPVFNEDGQLIGFLFGSPKGYSTDSVIIPMSKEALEEAFGVQ